MPNFWKQMAEQDPEQFKEKYANSHNMGALSDQDTIRLMRHALAGSLDKMDEALSAEDEEGNWIYGKATDSWTPSITTNPASLESPKPAPTGGTRFDGVWDKLPDGSWKFRITKEWVE